MAKKLDFETSYDVAVCGGGLAGVSAALASARRGLKTCLIEKTVFSGGLATTGNVLIYLPLNDRRNNQVTFGISEELLHESVKYGPGQAHVINPWDKGHVSVFNPASFILRLDEILVESKVDVWFDSLACGVQAARGTLKGVEVENKSGRGLVKAKVFVDATGDADIAFRAGAPCATQLNHMSIWATGISPEVAQHVLGNEDWPARKILFAAGAGDDGSGHPEGIRHYDGVNAKDVSEFILVGRRLLLERCKKEQAKLGPNGRCKFFPMGLPAMANFRTTRRIEAQLVLESFQPGKHYKDCVGLVAEWKRGEEVWELPYRSLLPKKLKNLLAAGRCIGSAGAAWSTFRVIQAAAMSGEVAGLAASMSAERGVEPGKLPVEELQGELKRRKFLLDVRELGAK